MRRVGPKSTGPASEGFSGTMTTLGEMPGPWPPAPRVEETLSENRNQHQRKGKQITHIQPPPCACHLHGPWAPSLEGEENHRPSPPIHRAQPQRSTKRAGGGPERCPPARHPCRWGLPHPQRCQDPFPSVRSPSHLILRSPESHI